MRKILLLAAAAILPFFLWAQQYYSFSEEIPSKIKLYSINNATVLIQPIAENSQTQKWLSFDANLNLIAAKKLVTPNAGNIIGQTYLERVNKIVRIDQSIVNDVFYVSAFVFNSTGDIVKKQDINLAAATKSKLLAAPFIVLQSPDKHIISLLQVRRINHDSIMISAISIDENLATIASNQFLLPLDENLEELLPPMNDNKGNIYILTADRFDSYKLGTLCKGYIVTDHDKLPQQFKISINRRKLSDYYFQIVNGNMHFSALFSKSENKEAIAGILYGQYNFEKQQLTDLKEKVFDDAFKSRLKKQFQSQGYKGKILNYLYTLPHPSLLSEHISYAILLPIAEKNKRPTIQDEIHTINNLLLLDAEVRQPFVKIRMPVQPELQFLAYLPSAGQYSALHYYNTSSGKARLKLTTINTDGIHTEKNFSENANKILLYGYTYTVNSGSLITFYKDKHTGEMGLVKIEL